MPLPFPLPRVSLLSGLRRGWVAVAVVSLVVSTSALGASVDGLTVDYRERPLGIDNARPRFGWRLRAEQRGERQTAYRILVASSPEALGADRGDLWDSGELPSGENVGVDYAGRALRANQRCYWKVRVRDARGQLCPWSEPSWWQMGLLAPADWKARWIAGAGSGSPRFRHEFQLPKHVVRATAHVFGFGWYRLWANGREVTDRVLAPVNSNYTRALFYDTYDITGLVHDGANVLGLWLGQGYGSTYSKYGYRWASPLAAIAQFEFVFDDDTTATVVTDADWKWALSPIVANDIYNGETFDARREDPRWSTVGYDDRDWDRATPCDIATGLLKSCPFGGIAVAAELRPVKLWEPRPGVYVFDLGQNMAGWVRLRVKGRAGTPVGLRHAEEINPDGTLDITTNRLALATDTYVLSGKGEETYEPRFTYHGFRYVEVTGYPGTPTLETVTGCAVHAKLEDGGSFRCSDPLVNRMHENFRWTIANNLMGIPTDTAARDERTPCQMDSLAVEDAAICNFAADGYYTKWLHDITDDGGSLPNWTGDQVVLPFLLYWNYGDTRILTQRFAAMKRTVDRFVGLAKTDHPWAGGYGDWAPPRQPGNYETSFSEGELVNRAFLYRAARIVAETAAVLGESADARRYSRLADGVRDAFDADLYHPADGRYSSGRQVTSILPLAFQLVSEPNRARVVQALRRRVEDADQSHLDTGIFGTRYLFEVLIDHGMTDLAWKVLTNPGYPGYVDQIAQGATTTWEQWSFRGGMQTHDHAMFSGPDATLFSRFGGILPARPGFREIVVRPAIPSGLSWVECARNTVMGRVASRWERRGAGILLRVSIPPNSTAHVYVPAKSVEAVTEHGERAAQAGGVLAARFDDGCAIFTVGSGEYEFSTVR